MELKAKKSLQLKLANMTAEDKNTVKDILLYVYIM